jgi:integrase
MAALQARHSRKCALGQNPDGTTRPVERAVQVVRGNIKTDPACTCQPVYFVAVRHNGKKERREVGRNAKEALRAFTRVQSQKDAGEYQTLRNIGFDEFAEEWLRSLKRPKANTIRGYRTTMEYGKAVFGGKRLRNMTPADITAFVQRLPELGPEPAKPKPGQAPKPRTPMSASTMAKHLRHLNACFTVAVLEGYMVRNPVKGLHVSQRPASRANEAGYFEDDELPRLFAEFPDGLYRAYFTLALRTGMRLGELSALKWGSVNLTDSYVAVSESYTHGELGTPKSQTSRREVYIDPGTVKFLGEWWRECDQPGDEELVLRAPNKSGHLEPKMVSEQLRRAMKKAGVPEYDSQGRRRRNHSFRHTYARIVLENGHNLYEVQKQLGHSSYGVTEKVYGHLAREHRQQVAAGLEGAFAV